MLLAAKPGQSATVLVEFASIDGTRRNSSAGKDTKLPPPAMELSVPAIMAATNKKMAWPKDKLET